MNLKLEKAYSKAPIVAGINALKTQVDDMRPLPPDIEGRVMQKLRLDWNYNSNAIEGNKLNYGETVAFLMTGITAKGKPLKDYLDIKGHNEAINFLLSIVKESRTLTEADIRALHKMILVEPYEADAQTADGKPTKKLISIGEYKKQANHVKTATGEIHYYALPEETPAKMYNLMEWYHAAVADKSISPLVTAALFHHKFVEIHPFDDGNGRMSRMLMNLILMQHNYPPAVVKTDDRQNYYALLSRADTGDSWPFVEYIIERVEGSLKLYVKAVNGGDIDEDEDIDKEIALLKIELTGGIVAKERKSKKTITEIFQGDFLPLVYKISNKLVEFEEFFFETPKWMKFYYNEKNKDDVKYEYVTEESKDVYINLLSDNNKTFKNTVVTVDFKGYKNPENNFNIRSEYKIVFDDFYYVIYAGNTLLSSKLYHEHLTAGEISNIVKVIINLFKEEFIKNQKS